MSYLCLDPSYHRGDRLVGVLGVPRVLVQVPFRVWDLWVVDRLVILGPWDRGVLQVLDHVGEVRGVPEVLEGHLEDLVGLEVG